MRLMKKTVALLMTVLLTVGLLVVPASAEAENDDNLLELMLQLGIYDPADYMEYFNDNLMREELASILSIFYGVTELSYPVATNFPDVPQNWSSGHIETLVAHGIMGGYSDGLFRPSELVTGDQVIKTLVTMLGYDMIAKSRGGYPEGYKKIAYQYKMLDGLDGLDTSAAITKANFTRLLYNALRVDLIETISVGGTNEFASEKGKTLLTERLHIYKVSGRLQALPYVALGYEQSVGDGYIAINNNKFACDKDVYSFLGLEVSGYYRQDETDSVGEILYLEEEDNDDTTLLVEDKDIQTVTATTFTYEAKSKSKEVSISSDLIVIFNGKRLTYYTPAHLKPTQGSVRFIDTDANGVYDYAIVDYQINYVVGSVSSRDGVYIINEKNGKRSIAIDEDNANQYYVLEDAGLAYSIKKLQTDDVLSISADSIDLNTLSVNETSTVFRMKRSAQWQDACLTEIGEKQLKLGDTFYDTSAEMEDVINTLMPGVSYTFYMNYRNDIVACDTAISNMPYAILQAAYTKTSGLSSQVTLRLFKEDGTFAVMNCTDPIRIDGYTVKGYDNVMSTLKQSSIYFSETSGVAVPENDVWQLVKYSANKDGELTAIDTLVSNRAPSKEDLSYMDAYTSNNSIGWYASSGSLDGRYGVTTNSKMFEITGDKSDMDNYIMRAYNDLTSETTACYFFDGGEMRISKAVLRFPTATYARTIRHNDQRLMLYQGTKTVVDDEGEPRTCMYGTLLTSGAKVNVILANDNLIEETNIQVGNIVRWNANQEGQAYILEKTVAMDGSGVHGTTADPGGNYGSERRFTRCKVQAIDGTDMLNHYYGIGTDSRGRERNYFEPYRCDKNPKIYVYETNKNQVLTAKLADIRTVKAFGEAEADDVFIFFKSGTITSIVIYR